MLSAFVDVAVFDGDGVFIVVSGDSLLVVINSIMEIMVLIYRAGCLRKREGRHKNVEHKT